jgi:glyoxylase-like metal-dependent hydrolase (beta-lactamase superfamily II)
LPEDGRVPHLPGWRWIATPGHSPGHVSFFRDADRALIAGDAFVATKQESATAVLTQRPEIHGPPMYYTMDWTAAWVSVRRLVALAPRVAVTGHGVPLMGPALANGLHVLAKHFDTLAIPRHGRYVGHPASANENGVTYVPPPVPDPLPKIVGGVLLGLGALALARKFTRREDD